jgi:para-nitrobenzyl esterase
MRRLLVMFVVVLGAGSYLLSAADPVKVDGGLVSGIEVDGVRAYKGIPYAAPPLGDLRWREPQPVVGWTGVRKAETFAAPCMQASKANGEPSEDCLYLNVWTTATSREKRPVMVWIHGGGLNNGATAEPRHDGRGWAKKGVVAVTVGYRLGALGYLAHPQLTAESPHRSSGNYGTLDQVAALQWVQRNIGAFGGDPRNVTLVGVSAGSWSISALMASPLAKGLFARAIGQSGARLLHDWATGASLSNTVYLKESRNGIPSGEEAGLAFAKQLGTDSVKALRALPADKILSVPLFDFRRTIGGPTSPNAAGQFYTIEKVDGYLLPTAVRTVFDQGKQHRVPVIVGANDTEHNSILLEGQGARTLASYRARIEWQYGDMVKEYEALYPVKSEADILQAVRDSASDHDFLLQMRTWARLMTSAGSKAYLYHFSHVAPNPRTDFKANHMAELEYVFNNLVNPWPYTEVDRRLADAMSSYWTNFARTADPNGAGLPKWTVYNPKDEPYMEFGATPVPGHHVKQARLDFQERWSRRYPDGYAGAAVNQSGAASR